MKSKKSLSIICAIAVTLSTLVGCSSNTAGSSSGTVVVTLIQNKVEIQSQLEAAAKTFNESQTGVKVQVLGSTGDNLVTTLQSQFASAPAKAPTVFTCQSGSEFDKFFKYMAPMDSAKASKNIAKGQKDDAMKNGKLYGLPLAIEGIGLIYNKAIFKAAGVDPTSIKTMDDLDAACAKVAKVKGIVHPLAFSKETYFQFMHPFNWPFAVMSNYKEVIPKVISGQLKLKDVPEVKQFANDLTKLKPYTNLALDSYDDQVAGFAQGKYAMIHQGNWAQSIIDQYKVKFDYGMIPMPVNGNTSLAVGNTNFFHVNSAATKEQQAGGIKFLDWLLTSPAGQKIVTNEFKVIPAYNGFDTSKLPVLAQEVSKYSKSGKTVPWTFNLFPAGVDKDCTSAMQEFYAGKIKTDQLLDQIQEVWKNAAQK